MRKNCLFGNVIVALTIAAPAGAATWDGAYGGGHLGYGWGKADTSFAGLPNPWGAPTDPMPVTLRPKPNGAILGGQVGYNWQSTNQVTGIEADLSWADMRGTAIESPIILNNGTSLPGAGNNLAIHHSIDWFGTLRGRIGLATASNWLIYATGGLAFGGVKFSGNLDPRPIGTIQYPASSNKTRSGWTLGAGVEWSASATSSVKVEYLHLDLGSQSAIGNPVPPNPPFQASYRWKTRADILRAGMNFKF